jgi:glycosidase
VVEVVTPLRNPVPKAIAFNFMGQRATCICDPHAPQEQQWVWIVDYTVVYKHYGSNATMHAAMNKARRTIRQLVNHEPVE